MRVEARDRKAPVLWGGCEEFFLPSCYLLRLLRDYVAVIESCSDCAVCATLSFALLVRR